MASPKLLAFSGSIRTGSYNSAVLAASADYAAAAGAEVDVIDLADYALPIYDADLEDAEGLPEHAKYLKNQFRETDGFIIASPEYNSGYSPLLKNVIDWCSRAESDSEPPLAAYSGKSALLLSASPGPLGGLRGLTMLRTLLQNIHVTVFPEMLSVRSAHEVVNDAGDVADERWLGKIEDITRAYVAFARKLHP